MKRKMLSMKSSTSCRCTSRKYSAIVRPVRPDAETCARWLVHLPVDQRHVLENLGFLELEVEVVSFAGPLAYSAEDRSPAVALGHVVDQLLNHDRLSDTGATKETDFPAFDERGDQVDDLDAGLEDLGLGLEIGELRVCPGEWASVQCRGQRRSAVDRMAQHIQNAAQCRLTHWCGDRPAGVAHLHTARDAIGAAHRNRAHLVLADMLLHLGC